MTTKEVLIERIKAALKERRTRETRGEHNAMIEDSQNWDWREDLREIFKNLTTEDKQQIVNNMIARLRRKQLKLVVGGKAKGGNHA